MLSPKSAPRENAVENPTLSIRANLQMLRKCPKEQSVTEIAAANSWIPSQPMMTRHVSACACLGRFVFLQTGAAGSAAGHPCMAPLPCTAQSLSSPAVPAHGMGKLFFCFWYTLANLCWAFCWN